LLPDTPIRERLKVLRVLEDAQFEPPQPLRKNALGERLVQRWLNNESVDVRSRILIMSESIMLLSGLMLTISSTALLNPKCTLGSDEETWSCSTMQTVDVMLWALNCALQLLSVALAVSNVNIISVLNDAELRSFLALHWKHYQLAQLLMTLSGGLFLPSALVMRIWLLVPPAIATATTALIMVLCSVFGVYFVMWAQMFRGALHFSLGPLTFLQFTLANDIYVGGMMLPWISPDFFKATAAAGSRVAPAPVKFANE
jgi:hypothetical protein